MLSRTPKISTQVTQLTQNYWGTMPSSMPEIDTQPGSILNQHYITRGPVTSRLLSG